MRLVSQTEEEKKRSINFNEGVSSACGLCFSSKNPTVNIQGVWSYCRRAEEYGFIELEKILDEAKSRESIIMSSVDNFRFL